MTRKRESWGWFRSCALTAIVLLSTAALCDDDESPTDPGSGKKTGLTAVPLAIGHEWNYEGFVLARTEYDDASPTDTLEILTERKDEIVGTETRFGREYYLRAESIFEQFVGTADIDTTYWWERVRQSSQGLYGADIPLNEPPLPAFAVAPRLHANTNAATAAWERVSARLGAAHAAAFRDAWERVQARRRMSMQLASVVHLAGGTPEDLTLLSYPVQVGKEWTIRLEPLFATTVEAVETLDLPGGEQQAYRLRITSELFGANDSAVMWYGEDGFLGQSVHFEAVVMDSIGDPIGRMLWDEELRLQSFATGTQTSRAE